MKTMNLNLFLALILLISHKISLKFIFKLFKIKNYFKLFQISSISKNQFLTVLPLNSKNMCFSLEISTFPPWKTLDFPLSWISIFQKNLKLLREQTSVKTFCNYCAEKSQI